MNRETGRHDHDGCTERETFEITVCQLHRGDRTEGRGKRADDIRYGVRFEGQESVSSEALEDLYTEVGTETVSLETDTKDGDSGLWALECLWHRWNAGSGRESRAFIDAETRSLEIADVAIVDDQHYLALPIGWIAFDPQGAAQ